MNKILKKTVSILILIVLISNIFSSVIYAAEEEKDTEFSKMEEIWDQYGANNFIDGVGGVLTYAARMVIAVPVILVHTLLSSVAWGEGGGVTVTAEDILFSGRIPGEDGKSGIELLDINFFDLNDGNDNKAVNTIRKNIANWYYALRNIAIVMLLIVLIYIGIRMAISSVADEKAKYKKMLMDWVTSFALLFILHYLMIFVIELNRQLVTLLYNIKVSGVENTITPWDYSDILLSQIFSMSFTEGWGSLICYCMLLGVTVALFIQYAIRMFTIGFLVVIAPFITITYSVDKIGDSKSQALDTWLKEFIYNILIQPFHCIIYLVFVTAAYGVLDSGSISGMVFAVLSILFIKKAEEIIKKIFGFGKASTLGSTAAAGMLAMNAANKFKSARSKAVKAAGKAKNQGGSSSGKLTTTRNATNNMNAASTTKATSGKSIPASKNASTTTTAPSSAAISTASNLSDDTNQVNVNTKGDKFKQGAKKVAMALGPEQAKWALKNAGQFMGATMAMGLTGNALDAYTGSKVGGLAGQLVGEKGRQIKGYAQAGIAGVKARQLENSANKALDRAKDRLDKAIQNYENNNLDKSDELIDREIENLVDGIGVPKQKQQELMSAISELNSIYKNMGISNSEELTKNDALDMHNKINKSLLNAANKLASHESYTSTDQIKALTDQITRDIDKLGEKNMTNYQNTPSYQNLTIVEQEYAKEVYKSKQVLQTLNKTKKEANRINTNTEISNKVKKSVERRINDGTITIE